MSANNGTTIHDESRRIFEELYCNQQPGKLLNDLNKASELLSEFRILTREKTLNPDLFDEKCVGALVEYSSKGLIEAQKCISNLILNYPDLRTRLVKPYVKCVENRFGTRNGSNHYSASSNCSRVPSSDSQVLYHDLRILFLLSALCPGERSYVRDRLAEQILSLTASEAEALGQDNYPMIVESLKTLFNLTLDSSVHTTLAATVIKRLFHITESKKDVIQELEGQKKPEATDKLLVSLIHLLTNMPKEAYIQLSKEDCDKIIGYLDDHIKIFAKNSHRDVVLPVLNVCTNICRHKEDVRARWFEEILRSNKDFNKRPEEYDNIRGRLVSLMTSVDIHVKDIAAEFLYKLCSDDTEKFITYTGFGNAAAYLSTRGLLSQSHQTKPGSHREDKDYLELRSRLDPITGKLEAPRENPMEGMSEEQKEWHTNELADAIAKLSNLGVMKPMRIDDRGRLSELHPESPDHTEDANSD